MTLGLRELTDALAGLAPESLAVSPESVIVVLDRTLSPAAVRRLKDLRHSSQNIAWPNPGVVSIPELARKILSHCEGIEQRVLGPRKKATLWQSLAFVMARAPQVSPLQALSLVQSTKPFWPLGLELSGWKEILVEFEKTNPSEELRPWSQKILSFLHLAGDLRDHQISDASEWESVRACVEILPLFNGRISWELVTERPSNTKITILVPHTREAYPLEKKFLDEISKHLRVTWIEPGQDQGAELEIETIPLMDLSLVSPATSSLYWLESDKIPSPQTATQLLPGSFAIDMAFADDTEHSLTTEALRLWIDFHIKLKPTWHPLHTRPEMLAQLKAFEIDIDDVPYLEKILSTLDDEVGPEILSWIQRDSKNLHRILEWVAVFDHAGIFKDLLDPDAQERHRLRWLSPRLDPSGVPLLSINDLGVSASRQILLWGNHKSLHEFCDPLSSRNIKTRLFPSQLTHLLEAQGLAIPSPERDAELAKRILADFKDLLRFMPSPSPATMTLAAPPALNLQSHRKILSATQISTYMSCPAQYAFRYIENIKEAPPWDPPEIQADLKGQWVHKVLEQYFEAPNWSASHDQIFAQLRELFANSEAEIFKQKNSAGYKRYLLKLSVDLARRLTRHIELFEKPLFDAFGVTRRQREEQLKTSELNGYVDRIDYLKDESQVFLWDFKTGKVPKRIDTQISHGKIQFFFYRMLLQELRPQLTLQAGGYLNPLVPARSHLIVLGEQKNEVFERIGASTGMTITKLSVSALAEIDASLKRAIEEVRKGLEASNFETTSKSISSTCLHCDFQGLCGRPFLEESSGGAPQDESEVSA